MTQHSSAELDSTPSVPVEVPLLDRPLIADEENTVVSTGLGDSKHSHALASIKLSSTAQEIRDRLFAGPDAPNSEHSLRIGHFEVDERIGSGGMGAVFRAVDLELSRYVALKVLHPQTAADPALVSRFRNEARACAQLNHDNVARVFFAGDHDGVHYIAYEYADGFTIKQLIDQKGRLTPEETVNYAIQATLALNHINACGVVHRDIKPSNIILTQAGRIKVVDLGLARRDTTDSIGDLTVAGTTLGTFDYIAPEQARDPRTADTRSDIYSLGCTVYHMLTGQPPYPEGTALQKLLDHQGKAPPDARAIAPDVPVAVSAVVQKMMNTDADARYQDPGQLLADLISIASHMGLRSVPAEGIVWRRIPIRRTREVASTVLVATTILAICVTALIMHFSPSGLDKSDAETERILNAMLPVDAAVVTSNGSSSGNSGESNGVVDVTQEMAANGPENTSTAQIADVVPVPPDNAQATLTPPVTNAGKTDDTPVLKTQQIGNGLFRVESVGGNAKTFSSLALAWGQASPGDEIILDFDGRLDTPTRCLQSLYGEPKILTIRAAEGKSPVLEFRGDDLKASGAANDPGRLVQLTNNLNLKIVGVHLVVKVMPEVSTAEWSLFEFDGANRIELSDCTIEVNNPANIRTSIFRLPDSKAGNFDKDQCSISIENCAVRGGCDLVRIAGQAMGQLSAEHSFFALDGSLVDNVGSNAMVLQGDFTADIRHTTSICSRPSFRMADSDSLDGDTPERTVPQLSVFSRSCVFASLKPNGVLVKSEGNFYLDELQELFRWHGTHDFYHQMGVYWRLESGAFDRMTTELSFDDWQDHWSRITGTQEDDPEEFETIVWESPEPLSGLMPTDLASVSPADFRLNRAKFKFSIDSNFLHHLSKDGSMPGVDTSILPEFPDSATVVIKPPVTKSVAVDE